eukprot:c5588_g1_i1.p1 GENE.c5588_g1_i1~~c5588_g1_i1.p1  ORF type:complete len:228 (+),score=67.81 c5588_g1_i1:43-684(+)
MKICVLLVFVCLCVARAQQQQEQQPQQPQMQQQQQEEETQQLATGLEDQNDLSRSNREVATTTTQTTAANTPPMQLQGSGTRPAAPAINFENLIAKIPKVGPGMWRWYKAMQKFIYQLLTPPWLFVWVIVSGASVIGLSASQTVIFTLVALFLAQSQDPIASCQPAFPNKPHSSLLHCRVNRLPMSALINFTPPYFSLDLGGARMIEMLPPTQ